MIRLFDSLFPNPLKNIDMKKFLFALALLLICFPAFSQSGTGAFSFEGLQRDYRFYVPTAYNPATPAPLVFNLHGYTSNGQQQEFYSNMNAVADTAGFIVCYPNGVSNSWNSGFTPPYYGGVNDVGFLSVLIDSLSAQFNIDPARIYSCGMSNGGFMSLRLACDLESRIAAVGSVTGTMTSLQFANCNASRAVPVVQIHGDLDATVAYFGNALSQPVDSVLAYWRSVNGCTAAAVYDTLPDLVQEGSTVTTQYYGGCNGGTEVLHYKVANGGHTWPGAFPIPAGITNQDIDASVELWRFFLRHTHPNPVTVGVEEALVEVPTLSYAIDGNAWLLEGNGMALGYELWSLKGQRIQVGELDQGEREKVDATGLSAGMYVFRFSNGASLRAIRW